MLQPPERGAPERERGRMKPKRVNALDLGLPQPLPLNRELQDENKGREREP